MNDHADIAVVLVGCNSRVYLQQCLRSLFPSEDGRYRTEVVYVDNASADGTVEMVRDEFPTVQIIVNATNAGFCRACNQGVEQTKSRYIYLLNNDTVLFSDTIPKLAEFLDRTPSAGAAANRLLNPDLSDQWSARRFPSWSNALLGRRTLLSRLFSGSQTVRDYLYKDEMAKDEPFSVDWVPGSCTLVRRQAYVEVGGLPEDMFYWSDAVFCDRLSRAGWRVYVVPTAKLIHFEGHGTGRKTRRVRRFMISDFHQGAFRFYCEHNGLGRWNPARWVAKVGLELRACALSAMDWIANWKTESAGKVNQR